MTERAFDDSAFFDALSAHIAERIPGFAVRYKDESRRQRALALVLKPFVPGYLTDFTTTLYPVVWFTRRRSVERFPKSSAATLAHEYVHLWDQQRARVRFPLGYIFPQVVAAGALGAISAVWLGPWALLFLLCLAALAPWPARFRAHAEVRGYAMDLAVQWWRDGEVGNLDSVVRIFTGWAYYRMWPDEAAVTATFEQIAACLEATGLPFDEASGEDLAPYRDVRALVETLRESTTGDPHSEIR